MNKFPFFMNESLKFNLQYGKPLINQWPQLKFIAGLVMGLVMLLPAMEVMGQVPTRFNQQAVVRDTTGQVVANRSLRLRVSLEQMVGGAAVMRYREMHQVTTNANGLYTVEVGGGAVELGQMDSVRWELGSVYLKTEVDPSGGQSYLLSSNRELLSVPYALYSVQAQNAQTAQSLAGGNGTLATVRTVGVTGVMYTGSRVEASLDASGGEFVLSKGFCVDTLPVPTVDKGIAIAGGGLGAFELGLNSLEPGRMYYVRAYATTAAGTAYGQVLSFQTRALAVPSPTTEAASGVGAFGAQLRGSLADTASGGMALTARGFRWSQTAGFASASGQDLPVQATAGQDFSAQLQGLMASTTYYFRAYASNALGTGYGAEVSFTTGTQPLATVQTQAPLGVSQTQALVEGIVTDDAGAVVTARGFCYSTNNNPLISNDTVLAGTGLGTFTATLRNLITDTTYFYRAFAINAGGVGYGLVQSFQTSSGSGSITAPLVTTTPVIRTDSNHVMGGVITWDGNSSISSQGICWNRTGMPTLSDSVILFTPQGLGSFTLAVQLPLGCHEPFYVRAFAQNAVGVSYGNEFLTTNGYQPRLIGTQMTQIGGLTANLQSNVVTTGGCPILERGVCWGTSPNPTNSNSFYGRTVCSPDTGVMNCQLNHLFPQTLYYARAYMVNATGTYYGDEVTFTTDTTSELYIGKLHAGGLIFYLDSTRQHGMVCTPNDLGGYHWGCYGTDIPNTSTSFGAGFMNTSLITLNCTQRPIAASVCADLVLNGYSDWFLPSIGELQLMYSRLHLPGLGGFGGSWYWSSSQVNPNGAWVMDGSNGDVSNFYGSSKFFYSQVRAVRAF
jgi:hypothetical protein